MKTLADYSWESHWKILAKFFGSMDFEWPKILILKWGSVFHYYTIYGPSVGLSNTNIISLPSCPTMPVYFTLHAPSVDIAAELAVSFLPLLDILKKIPIIESQYKHVPLGGISHQSAWSQFECNKISPYLVSKPTGCQAKFARVKRRDEKSRCG